MGRAPCCDKASVKRGPWSPEEDDALRSFIQSHGTGGNWISLPARAGLKRCGKSCRLRWLNYLRPDIKHGGFTEEEDNIIVTLYNNIGSRWSVIASHLPRRTDNDVKNYWNTKLKKKLSAAERVPVLNKPVVPKAEGCYNYGPAAPPPPPPQRPSMPLVSNPAVVLDHDQLPHLGLMQVSELINTSTYSSNISSSTTQEVSSLSAASSSLALDDNGGRGLLLRDDDDGDDQFFIDFGSPYELLSGFCCQQQPLHGLIMDQI